jgi:hypothetical protein
VWLVEQLPGQSSQIKLAGSQTDANGMVQLSTPPISRDVRLRLVAGHGVRSAPVHIAVIPTVSANVVVAGWSYLVAVTASGTQPGDFVVLEKRTAAGWMPIASLPLDAAGAAHFSLSPPAKGSNHYRLLLPSTPGHAGAVARFVVPLP